jgi:hypothetical protein
VRKILPLEFTDLGPQASRTARGCLLFVVERT